MGKWLVMPAAAALAGIAMAGGSGMLAVLKPDRLSQDRRPFDLDPALWQAAWGRILHDNVDAQGHVNFAMKPADRALLREIVSFIAVAGPQRTKDAFNLNSAREAYYLNAYNALAMNGIITVGTPEQLTFPRRFGFFFLRRVHIDGTSTTLYAFENDVVRKMGDPRVHFALNCMTFGCPRLRADAFTASNLDYELDSAAREFINDPAYVQVDAAQRTVKMSSIFKFYTADFLKASPTLLDYINVYRHEPVPTSYRIEFLDYDWTVKAAGLRSPH